MTQAVRSKQSKMDNYHSVRYLLVGLILLNIFHLLKIIYDHYKLKEPDQHQIMIFYVSIVEQISDIIIFTILYVLVGRIV